MFETILDKEISAKWIPFVYPTDIIGTGLLNEMQNSEEKGLVKSQYCMAYKSIITKLESKLNATAIPVLRAILIINILKFKIYDKTNCLSCIHTCSGLSNENVKFQNFMRDKIYRCFHICQYIWLYLNNYSQLVEYKN